jgi:transposase InsO family protein
MQVGMTRSPTDAWTAQQLREATPYGHTPKYLIRDNDSKFGPCFARVAATSGIEILKTPCHAPRANAICERFLGSVRRECLDHVLVLHEKQLHRVLRAYVVNACVNLRRNNFDPPVIFVPTVTISRVLSYVCSAPERSSDATPPPCGSSSPPGHTVVDGWRRDERTRDILQSLPRSLVSSAKPTTGVQVVRPAAPNASTRSLRMPAEQGPSALARPGAALSNATIP